MLRNTSYTKKCEYLVKTFFSYSDNHIFYVLYSSVGYFHSGFHCHYKAIGTAKITQIFDKDLGHEMHLREFSEVQ